MLESCELVYHLSEGDIYLCLQPVLFPANSSQYPSCCPIPSTLSRVAGQHIRGCRGWTSTVTRTRPMADIGPWVTVTLVQGDGSGNNTMTVAYTRAVIFWIVFVLLHLIKAYHAYRLLLWSSKMRMSLLLGFFAFAKTCKHIIQAYAEPIL